MTTQLADTEKKKDRQTDLEYHRIAQGQSEHV